LLIHVQRIAMPHPTEDHSSNISDHAEHPPRVSSEHDRDAQSRAARRRGRYGARRLLELIESETHDWLVANSVTLLRVSLGAVFLGFGFLKFFPMVSPAEDLVIATTSMLTFDLIPGSITIVATAVLECVIGLWLLIGRALRGATYLLVIELVGILSPVALLSDRLFSGPHNAPTLQGQYVLKDVVIVAAALVVVTTARGAKLTNTRRRPYRRPKRRNTEQQPNSS
jgi:putative oxidoreductase